MDERTNDLCNRNILSHCLYKIAIDGNWQPPEESQTSSDFDDDMSISDVTDDEDDVL